MLRLVLLGWALGLALLATGCGGNGTLSSEEYVSRLNAICEDFSDREKEIGDPGTIAELAENGPRILDAFERTILDGIRELEAPAELADRAERLRAIAEEQREVLGDMIDAAKDNDRAKVLELVPRNEALNREAGSTARELGANACAAE